MGLTSWRKFTPDCYECYRVTTGNCQSPLDCPSQAFAQRVTVWLLLRHDLKQRVMRTYSPAAAPDAQDGRQYEYVMDHDQLSRHYPSASGLLCFRVVDCFRTPLMHVCVT